MTTRYVAIDLETTGVDREYDEIIEVGCIAFGLDGPLGEYHSLVRPNQHLPYQIERLTGIEAGELESAPRFAGIAAELREFIADSPVVGHNVAFDLEFLERAGVRPPGPVYDTFELAQVLLPTKREFSLRSLSAELELDQGTPHRALADAEAARRLFLALRDELCRLPDWMLLDLEDIALKVSWSAAALFREVLSAPRQGLPAYRDAVIRPSGEKTKPLNSTRALTPIDVDHVEELLASAGALTELFPAFERRTEQEEMAAAVAGALNSDQHLVVEAGTGTGKSLAYLLPAALYAIRNQQRVIVSTDTIGLQEQLTGKDLPAVQAILAGTETEALRVAQLKGRRNYLCLLRWTTARHAGPASKEEALLMARVLVWLTQTETGDRSELNLYSSYDAAWSRLSAENVACLQVACPFVKEGTCFLLRAKRRAEAAHVLVVNHALLLSDLATGGHVLPQYDRLIIDEAHNLEDEATSRLAFRASQGDIEIYLDRVGRRAGDRGGLVGLLTGAAAGSLTESLQILGPGAYLASLGATLATGATKVRQRLADPYRLLAAVLRDCGDSQRENDDRLLITRATRVQPIWSDVQIAAENLDLALADLTSLIEEVRGQLEAGSLDVPDRDALLAEVADLHQGAWGYREGLSATLLREDASLICWLEQARTTGEVVVCSAPLQVADILRRELFEAKSSVILTSATLSTEATFDYLRERVGLDDTAELMLGSPFDFPRSTLILLPEDLPEPNEPEYVAATAELLIEACRASQGRALLLFTSYRGLNAAYDAIKGPLEAEGLLVLAHGSDGTPRQMLAALRENPRTVLLGTASFWEGVDVAGEALSLLVIARLPFAVPTDPIYRARSDLYDDPFEQYALPQAILRFRQGFGRLIRSKTDRGVLLVLDRRIRSRKYGDAFLRSLPRCSLKELASREVAGAVESWLK